MWRVSSGNSKDSKPPLIEPLYKKPSYLNTMFSSPTPPTAYYGFLLKQDFPVENQHLSSGSERNKQGVLINTEEVSMGAARWTPTPEQLYALEEIYQTGTRTPSAAQIQQIAARLRRFGKIEGKNVFYWFQNHKARERQKRRRQQLTNDSSQNEHVHVNMLSLGLRRTGFEVEHAKNWVSPSDCSTISEESVVSFATAEVAQSETNTRIQFAETGLHLNIGTSIRQQLTDFSYTSCGVNKSQNHKKLVMPCRDMKHINIEREYQTLELFPRWIGDHDDQYQLTDATKIDNHSQVDTTNFSSNFSPTRYFEFLPLKN